MSAGFESVVWHGVAGMAELICCRVEEKRVPELPEVETVCRAMAPVMTGQIVSDVILRRADLRKPFPSDLAERLNGAQVTGLRRRSKYILIDTNKRPIGVSG